MKRGMLILAITLIAFGIVGLITTSAWQSASLYTDMASYGNTYGMMGPGMMRNGGMAGNGMMSGGMMNGMMGDGMMGMHGSGVLPNVNATPVPANRPIDREVKILARNSQFDPARLVLKQSETVQFAFTNQDSFTHNFGSTDAQIPFILLPANGTTSTTWVAAQKGTFSALCTFHPEMQMRIVVE